MSLEQINALHMIQASYSRSDCQNTTKTSTTNRPEGSSRRRPFGTVYFKGGGFDIMKDFGFLRENSTKKIGIHHFSVESIDLKSPKKRS